MPEAEGHDLTNPMYDDEAEVRAELTRVFDVCNGCRRCVDLCASFPTLFEMIERHDDGDAGRLTPAQQDLVVDQCFQCKLCASICPYLPGVHELAIDVPRLVTRSVAMQRNNRHMSGPDRRFSRLLGHVDLLGRIGTKFAPVVNSVVDAKPGSLLRKVVAKVTGATTARPLLPYARRRFSTWFDARPTIKLEKKQAAVTIFPTCLVEYHATDIGQDLAKVYERNGIECSRSAAGCCGAPSLHAGDLARFRTIAQKNVKRLVAEVRAGNDVVVPQPTCSYVIKHEYPDHVVDEALRADARIVAAHTYDAAGYLMTLHKGDDYVLDTDFDGDLHRRIAYHAPTQLRAQDIGFPSRDLMKLTGAKVKLVQASSGVDSSWGLRSSHDDVAERMGERLGAAVDAAAVDVVAGDCVLAGTVITANTTRRVIHPLSVIARAYGIAEESPNA